MKSFLLTLILSVSIAFAGNSQVANPHAGQKIQWMTLEEALLPLKKNPAKSWWMFTQAGVAGVR